MTVDQLLKQLRFISSPSLGDLIPYSDSITLLNLIEEMQLEFITQNQANLIIKILENNAEKLLPLVPELSAVVQDPIWSKSFKPVEKYQKMYITCDNGFKVITLDFSFSTLFRDKIAELRVGVKAGDFSIITITTCRYYEVELTENAVVKLVNTFKTYDFEISDEILSYYNTITAWKLSDINNQLSLDNASDVVKNAMSLLKQDEFYNTKLIDRRIKYQYFMRGQPNESLLDKIAYRETPEVWVNWQKYELGEVVKSLIDLERMPLLFVFNTTRYNEETLFKQLKMVSQSLEDNGIIDSVGVFCRLNNKAGKAFNEFITAKQYNIRADNTTQVVAINRNLPKFLLELNWNPMSVICIGDGLPAGRTAMYTRRSDLVINYSEHEPTLKYNKLF
jgi:hypothetical protein